MLAVLLGDEGLEVGQLEVLALAHELLGHGEVDAVGFAADVLVDPGQLLLELLGAEGQRPEHAVAAGLRDGGDDVAAVREGEEGNSMPRRSQISVRAWPQTATPRRRASGTDPRRGSGVAAEAAVEQPLGEEVEEGLDRPAGTRKALPLGWKTVRPSSWMPVIEPQR